MNYVIGTVNGDSLDIFRRDDETVIVFTSKEQAESVLGMLLEDGDIEDTANVYGWY